MYGSIETCRDAGAPQRAACQCKSEPSQCEACDSSLCRTTDGKGGYDCWGNGEEEPFACDGGKIAKFTGEDYYSEWFEFTCCPSQLSEEDLEKLMPGTMKPVEFAQLKENTDLMESATFESVDADSSGGVEYEEFYQYYVPLLIKRDGCDYNCAVCREVAEKRCREIGETCGGNGSPSCFWPNAGEFKSKGGACFGYSFDEDERGFARNISAYKKIQPLPFQSAPPVEHIRSTPVVFSAENPEAAEKILDKMYAKPFNEEEDALKAASANIRNAMWTILMIPRLGCGQLVVTSGRDFANNTFVASGATSSLGCLLNATVQEAVCKLLQHGESTAAPCCLDISAAGQLRLSNLLTKLFDQAFAAAYLAQLMQYGLQLPTEARCVRPDYGRELSARLPPERMISLAEGLAVVAQAFDLPFSRVHPQLETQNVPECFDKGTCSTPHGMFARACVEVMRHVPDFQDILEENTLGPRAKSEPRELAALREVLLGDVNSKWICRDGCRLRQVEGPSGPMTEAAGQCTPCIGTERDLANPKQVAPCMCVFQILIERLADVGMAMTVFRRHPYGVGLWPTSLPKVPLADMDPVAEAALVGRFEVLQ